MTPWSIHPFHHICYLSLDLDPATGCDPPKKLLPEDSPLITPYMSTPTSEERVDTKSQPLPSDGAPILRSQWFDHLVDFQTVGRQTLPSPDLGVLFHMELDCALSRENRKSINSHTVRFKSFSNIGAVCLHHCTLNSRIVRVSKGFFLGSNS